jgi:hypothetical protein
VDLVDDDGEEADLVAVDRVVPLVAVPHVLAEPVEELGDQVGGGVVGAPVQAGDGVGIGAERGAGLDGGTRSARARTRASSWGRSSVVAMKDVLLSMCWWSSPPRWDATTAVSARLDATYRR